jgi:hypothetical protein
MFYANLAIASEHQTDVPGYLLMTAVKMKAEQLSAHVSLNLFMQNMRDEPQVM